jgi:hypothetical protein
MQKLVHTSMSVLFISRNTRFLNINFASASSHRSVPKLKYCSLARQVPAKKKAELLNNYFVSIGTVDDGACPNVTAAVSPGVSIESMTFGASEILRELKALDPKGSAGPDGYAPGLLKKLSESLVLPLSLYTVHLCQ